MSSQPDASSASPTTAQAQPAISAEMHAEIDAAMKDLDAAAAQSAAATAKASSGSGKQPAIRGPRVVQAGREHRQGKVVSVGATDIFLEFGPKELGILPRAQYPEDKDLPVVGADLQVVIDKYEPSENIFICSRPGSVQKADWELLEAGQVVEARVSGVATKDNKQVGLELEVAGHRAFMPAGQISVERVPDLSVYVGEKLKCQVQRVERMGKGNIVLSRRDIIAEERKALAARLLESLTEGQTVEGTVRKIMPFGAFVDIGGVDGLVHLSDLTYDRIGFGEKAVQKFVQEGQRIKVRVLKVEKVEGEDKPKISLGIKQVQGDPFVQTAGQLTEGAEVTGKVVRIAEFGAFIEVAPGVDGLVHISEIDYKRVNRVEDVLKQDEVVRAKILKIDPGTRRISLSLKALKEPPAGPAGSGKKDRPGKPELAPIPETPALRRQREKFKQFKFKGGLGL